MTAPETETTPTTATESPRAGARRAVPLPVKLVYTAFVAVLVPFYLRAYGPTNFLYFCDVALLMTLVAVWTGSALLASAAAVGIFLPQMIWVADFLTTAVGRPLTGMTGYMFDPKYTLFVRFLSFFHFWLPFFLLWVLTRLGYDRRGFAVWSLLAWPLLAACYLWLPAPPPPPGLAEGTPVNVNYVFGFSESGPQTWLPGPAYLLTYALVLQVLVLWPTHAAFARWLPRAGSGEKTLLRRTG